MLFFIFSLNNWYIFSEWAKSCSTCSPHKDCWHMKKKIVEKKLHIIGVLSTPSWSVVYVEKLWIKFQTDQTFAISTNYLLSMYFGNIKDIPVNFARSPNLFKKFSQFNNEDFTFGAPCYLHISIKFSCTIRTTSEYTFR